MKVTIHFNLPYLRLYFSFVVRTVEVQLLLGHVLMKEVESHKVNCPRQYHSSFFFFFDYKLFMSVIENTTMKSFAYLT